MKVIKWCEAELCENNAWEKAYSEFESHKQAVQKMEKRLGDFQIQKRLKKNAFILDCFCGTGCMSEALKKLGFKNTVGLDLSLSLLLKNRSSKKVICGNAIKTKFKAKTFDAIFIQGGLHHLPKKNGTPPAIAIPRSMKRSSRSICMWPGIISVLDVATAIKGLPISSLDIPVAYKGLLAPARSIPFFILSLLLS